jgi:N6-L-threonylcarbamoyladenine synthase
VHKESLKDKEPLILGIETSCDETAAAVVAGGERILSNIIASQVELHARFGGVVPEVASRCHLELLNMIIDQALRKADLSLGDLDAIAVSYGPGLVGALLVGVATAKALAFALGIPLLAVNHLEGHIYANLLTGERIEFPLICLVASGGHTALLYLPEIDQVTLMGSTRDDAAGEAFDKIGRAAGLGYPGGPVIDRLAAAGNPEAIPFPRAYLGEEGRFDFSFSGLKSAVLNYLHQQQQKGQPVDKNDLAASFQAAVVEVLVEKTLAAARDRQVQQVLLAGGVAANSTLRRLLKEHLAKEGIALTVPPLELCTDNAAMIAAAGYRKFLRGDFAALDLNAVPNLSLTAGKLVRK